MKIFEINGGKIAAGVEVLEHTLISGVKIPVVGVGEQGRGSKYAFLPVRDAEIGQVITCAEIGKTKAGNPCLMANIDYKDKQVILVLRSLIGFRGGNSHTSWVYQDVWEYSIEKRKLSTEEINNICNCGTTPHIHITNDYYKEVRLVAEYEIWNTQILCEGIISQGKAGRMGSGHQYIIIVPIGFQWRLSISGRMYGQPSEFFYTVREDGIDVQTAEEMVAI